MKILVRFLYSKTKANFEVYYWVIFDEFDWVIKSSINQNCILVILFSDNAPLGMLFKREWYIPDAAIKDGFIQGCKAEGLGAPWGLLAIISWMAWNLWNNSCGLGKFIDGNLGWFGLLDCNLDMFLKI